LGRWFRSRWTGNVEERVRAYTKAFRESSAILNSIVTFSAQAQSSFQVNSEGTQLQFGQIRYGWSYSSKAKPTME